MHIPCYLVIPLLRIQEYFPIVFVYTSFWMHFFVSNMKFSLKNPGVYQAMDLDLKTQDGLSSGLIQHLSDVAVDSVSLQLSFLTSGRSVSREDGSSIKAIRWLPTASKVQWTYAFHWLQGTFETFPGFGRNFSIS